ncbi:MAG: transporter substrate-binding domain-containing protein [Alphaproteobacteria bacterium]|nr:transporter substrate-binding domain-containing protein [Alphaproteobacteria bacterium]
MKFSRLLLAIILSVAASAAVAAYVASKHAGGAASASESAYARVIRTGTLRCGYGVFAPYFTKDLKTGKYGGVIHDVVEAVGNHLGLKIVWAEEVGLGDIATALKTGKIDAYCGGVWSIGKRVRVIDYTDPVFYEPIFVYVRSDDHRFDKNFAALDSSTARVAMIDGEGSSLIAAAEFPKARPVSLPQLSTYADMFNLVVMNKADFLLTAPLGEHTFAKNNPGQLRPLDKPVRIFPMDGFVISYGEPALRDILNQAQKNIRNNGIIDKILDRYDPGHTLFWRVAKPYIRPQDPQGK